MPATLARLAVPAASTTAQLSFGVGDANGSETEAELLSGREPNSTFNLILILLHTSTYISGTCPFLMVISTGMFMLVLEVGLSVCL